MNRHLMKYACMLSNITDLEVLECLNALMELG